MAKKCKTTITIDELTNSIGVEKLEEVEERILEPDESYGYYYDEALKEAQEEGLSEDEAEAAAEEAAEESTRKEQYAAIDKWLDAVESAADYLYGQHKLQITIPTKMVGKGKDRQEVRDLDKIKVEPTETWRDAAAAIMETINGVGMFTFYSVKEFLDSGPYTACEAVMTHLNYIENYADVYGGRSASSLVEDSMRYNNPSVSTRGLKNKLLR